MLYNKKSFINQQMGCPMKKLVLLISSIAMISLIINCGGQTKESIEDKIIGEWIVTNAKIQNFEEAFDYVLEMNIFENMDTKISDDSKDAINDFFETNREEIICKMDEEFFNNQMKGKIYQFTADYKAFFDGKKGTWSVDENDPNLLYLDSDDGGKGKIEILRITDTELEAVIHSYIDEKEDKKIIISFNMEKNSK